MRFSKRLSTVVLLVKCVAVSASAGNVVIAAIGDSTTAGTPFFESPVESPPDGKGDPEGQYAYWMMRREPAWTVKNFGVDGERTDQIRARFEDAIKDHPRYVIILAGVNDVYQGVPLQDAADNLSWMYREAKQQGVLPIAATILPFNRATPLQTNGIHVINDFIRKAADKHNIPLAELHDAVADPKNPDQLNGSPDGLHPDIGGYRKMGEVLTKVIEEMERSRPHE